MIIGGLMAWVPPMSCIFLIHLVSSYFRISNVDFIPKGHRKSSHDRSILFRDKVPMSQPQDPEFFPCGLYKRKTEIHRGVPT